MKVYTIKIIISILSIIFFAGCGMSNPNNSTHVIVTNNHTITPTPQPTESPFPIKDLTTFVFNGPEDMTALETIKYYFEMSNDKNSEGLQGIVYNFNKEAYESYLQEFDNVNYVTYLSSNEYKNDKRIRRNYSRDNFYPPNPYEIRVFHVEFEENYKSDSYGNGNRTDWIFFCLVKLEENSNWFIFQTVSGYT